MPVSEYVKSYDFVIRAQPHSAHSRARSENESVREQDGGSGVGEVGWGRAEEGRAAEQSDLLSSPRRIINQVVRFPELQ